MSIGCGLRALAIALWLVVTSMNSVVPTYAYDSFNSVDATRLFPARAGALAVGAVESDPPAAPVLEGGRLIGYAFSTRAVSNSVGYGGRPIDIVAGVDLNGRISGAVLAAHEEPIFVIGVSPRTLAEFVTGLAGLDVRQPISAVRTEQSGAPDHVSGATVSSTVIKAAVIRAGRAVASSRGLLPAGAKLSAGIDTRSMVAKTWQALEREGAIAHLHLTSADVGRREVDSDSGGGFLDLYVALLTPPTIGQNLLGRATYERLLGNLPDGAHALMVAADGAYSFKGTAWRQSGRFDRIQLEQGGKTIVFEASDHDNLEQLAIADQPALREIGIFVVRPGAHFDPAAPWRLSLMVEPMLAPERQQSIMFNLEYSLPQAYLLKADVRSTRTPPVASGTAAPQENELWVEIWRGRTFAIAVTAIILLALLVVLFSHDILVRDVRRYRIARLSFLGFTVVFLGVYAGAQLSVVHIVTFAHAVLGGFNWDQFLLDPLSFILWSFVALCLLFWGRGVFCGWLCPFGALQELLNEGARYLNIKQIEVPWSLHERLWPIKYVIFLLILGISFKSISNAFVVAEIEPFKTVIALQFLRGVPYVAYALLLLAAGLFIERFFCRYLCPLGAALAIPARLRLFEWLKRRPQCGRECRICAARCTVQAINPIGTIVPNECIYCLQCQANYYDAKTCYPLIQRAQRRTAQSPKAITNAKKPGSAA
ncbi:MAG: regulatory protein NosR [Hyphomicrobiales bacterium]|nr:MAG: regulatory protein NosR [Hyphomicrobiales bacterium]